MSDANSPSEWTRISGGSTDPVTPKRALDDGEFVVAKPAPGSGWKRFVLAAMLSLVLIATVAFVAHHVAKDEDSPNPEPTVSWKLQAPGQVGNYIRTSNTEPTPTKAEADDKFVLTANYRDSEHKLIFLLSRPETDLAELVAAANLENVHTSNNAFCGILKTGERPACAKIVDDTGVMIVGSSDQNSAEINLILDEFIDAVATH